MHVTFRSLPECVTPLKFKHKDSLALFNVYGWLKIFVKSAIDVEFGAEEFLFAKYIFSDLITPTSAPSVGFSVYAVITAVAAGFVESFGTIVGFVNVPPEFNVDLFI